MKEYEPIFFTRKSKDSKEIRDDLSIVQHLFKNAAQPFLSTPWGWLGWSIILPSSLLLTPVVNLKSGLRGIILLWSFSVLLGGIIEITAIRNSRYKNISNLSGWAYSIQGNLSLVGLALTSLLIFSSPRIIPSLWLLIIGHSFYSLGSLADNILKYVGIYYQVMGIFTIFTHPLYISAFAFFSANITLFLYSFYNKRKNGS